MKTLAFVPERWGFSFSASPEILRTFARLSAKQRFSGTMNLVLDMGNTRLKAGVFDQNRLVEQAFWSAWTLRDVSGFAEKWQPARAILSSVAKPDAELTAFLEQKFQFIELSAHTPVPFRNLYRTPETLGKDRIAAAAGAIALFPQENVLTVDCGTCIKYDFVDAAGAFRGGNIAPGAAMRLRAMHHFTARLPEAAFELPASFVGDSTETALQNGALRGALLEIEGFAQVFAEKSGGDLRVILTGGDAEFFAKHLRIKNLTLEPSLVLLGLNAILNYNNSRAGCLDG